MDPRKTKNVIILMSKGFTPQVEGVTRFAQEHDWCVIPINCRVSGGELVHADTQTTMSFKSLRNAWHPDGVIVDTAAATVVYAKWHRFGMPMVFPGHRPEEIGAGTVCVASDSRAVAEAAAHELFSLGYPNYAFAPGVFGKANWCRERAAEFARIVEEANARFFKKPTVPLRHWLRHLPKPCGIFAANDCAAEEVRAACLAEDLRIPEAIGLIGVDNRQSICESGGVTISSIEQDLKECYYKASELLDMMIDNEALPERTATFGVLRVVRRASTRRTIMADPRVKKALEFIRLHAAGRITPDDVVAAMGCRRSYGDSRFKHCTGRTIVEEISTVRVELVKEALRVSSVRLCDLPASCGFASDIDMRRVFKKLTGMSPREWRRQTTATTSRSA